jgi:Zn-dependent protease with chaperone function
MKDLSREEKSKQEIARSERKQETEQHISKLEKRIIEMAEEGRKKKWIRIRFTFYILSALVYYIALDTDLIGGTAGLLSWLLFAPLIAVGVMLISYLILAYIINGIIKDAFAIGEMEGRKAAIQLSKLNKE